MMPPTNANIYCKSIGVKKGFTNSSAIRAPTGSDSPCASHNAGSKRGVQRPVTTGRQLQDA